MDEKTVIMITFFLVKLGIFISAFAAFYFVRMQKYEHYSYAFKKYGSAREKAAVLLIYLVAYTVIAASFLYLLSSLIPW